MGGEAQRDIGNNERGQQELLQHCAPVHRTALHTTPRGEHCPRGMPVRLRVPQLGHTLVSLQVTVSSQLDTISEHHAVRDAEKCWFVIPGRR